MKKSILITTALLSLATTSILAQAPAAGYPRGGYGVAPPQVAPPPLGHRLLTRTSVVAPAPFSGRAASFDTAQRRYYLATTVPAGTAGAMCRAKGACYKLIGLGAARSLDLNQSGTLERSELANVKLIAAANIPSGFKVVSASRAGVQWIDLRSHMVMVGAQPIKLKTVNVTTRSWSAHVPYYKPAPVLRTKAM